MPVNIPYTSSMIYKKHISFIKNVLLYLPVLLSHVHVGAQDAGFFLNDWKGKTAEIPSFIKVEKAQTVPGDTLFVDANQVINKVPEYVYGNNMITWDNELTNSTTAITDIRNLNPHVIRWPGGSLSDNYFWNQPYQQRPDDIPESISPWYGMDTRDWQMSVDEYYQFLSNTNSTGHCIVNYGYARYGTSKDPVAKAAHMAADWVRYDNGRSKFWEIGNENYGSWESGHDIDTALNQDGQPQTIDGTLYGQHCRIFIDSMRNAANEVGSDIKIGVVMFNAEESSYDPNQSDWNEQVLKEVGDLADFLSVHTYFTPKGKNLDADSILHLYGEVGEIMDVIKGDLAEVGRPMIPLAMTEWNIFAEGSMQQVSYVNGMLAAIVLGEFIENGYGMGNRWILSNAWNDGNDHGVFSRGGEPGVDPYNPRPVFYYMYFFQKYFGDKMVKDSLVGNSNILAYSSIFSSGEIGMIMVNRGTEPETVFIDVSNYEPGVFYYTQTLTGGDDNGEFSRKVYINGLGTDEEGGGPDNYASLKAVRYEVDGGIKIDLPSRSVVYTLIEKKGPLSYVSSRIDTGATSITLKFSEEIQFSSTLPDFDIILNGEDKLNVIDVFIDEFDKRFLHIVLDTVFQSKSNVEISYSGSEIVTMGNMLLLPFSNETVSNNLPPEPVRLSFITKHSASGKLIENCKIVFDGDTLITDSSGTAEIMARPGNYTISAWRPFMDSINTLEINVPEKDTSIALAMDSTLFNLSVLILKNKDEAILNAHIYLKDMTFNTNSSGMALIKLYAGFYSIIAEATNCIGKERNLQLQSDSTLIIDLVQTHAEVIIRVRTGEQPLTDARVTIGNDTLTTGTLGKYVFPSVPLSQGITCHVEKDNFYDVRKEFDLVKDTALIVYLEKSVADIEFRLSADSGTIEDPFAVINNDTAWFTGNEYATFNDLPKNIWYTYRIESKNTADYLDSIFLVSDTSIRVLVYVGIERNNYGSGEILIFPNPTSNKLSVISKNKDIRKIEIYTMTGKLVYSKDIHQPLKKMQIYLNIPGGLYLIKIQSEYKQISSLFLMK